MQKIITVKPIKPVSLRTQISASIMIALAITLLLFGTAHVTAMFTGPTEREEKLIEKGMKQQLIVDYKLMNEKDEVSIRDLQGKIGWRNDRMPEIQQEIDKMWNELFMATQ